MHVLKFPILQRSPENSHQILMNRMQRIFAPGTSENQLFRQEKARHFEKSMYLIRQAAENQGER